MASLRLRNGKWYAVWYTNGKQVVKTTNVKAKGEKEKKLAQTAADAMEQAARGNITISAAMDALRKVSATVGFKTKIPTVKEYLTHYKPTGSESHVGNVKRAIGLFIDHLGEELYQPLDMLSVQSCRAFIEEQLKRVSVTTARNYKGYLHNAIQLAVEDEIIPRNPFALVSMKRITPKDAKHAMKRLPFAIEEIHEIIKKTVYPWQHIVLLCILTGGRRLGEVLTMRWKQVDWEKKGIIIKTFKSGKVVAIPITNELKKLLLSLYKDGEEYVFPDMAAKYVRSKGTASSEFTAIIKGLGLIKPENIHTGANGRKICDKTFHSLRHSVVSMLRVNASFTSDLIMDTIGHDSLKVEQGYFTASLDSKRNIIDFLAQQITPTSD